MNRSRTGLTGRQIAVKLRRRSGAQNFCAPLRRSFLSKITFKSSKALIIPYCPRVQANLLFIVLLPEDDRPPTLSFCPRAIAPCCHSTRGRKDTLLYYHPERNEPIGECSRMGLYLFSEKAVSPQLPTTTMGFLHSIERYALSIGRNDSF